MDPGQTRSKQSPKHDRGGYFGDAPSPSLPVEYSHRFRTRSIPSAADAAFLQTEMSDAPPGRKFAKTCDTCKARKVRCSGKLSYRAGNRYYGIKKKRLIVAARRSTGPLPEMPRRPL